MQSVHATPDPTGPSPARPAPPALPPPYPRARYAFDAELWASEGASSWHFVTVPQECSDEIAELTRATRRGFGSVRVTVTVGDTSWQTSVFPDTARGAYVLPVKRAVRRREELDAGDEVPVVVELLD